MVILKTVLLIILSLIVFVWAPVYYIIGCVQRFINKEDRPHVISMLHRKQKARVYQSGNISIIDETDLAVLKLRDRYETIWYNYLNTTDLIVKKRNYKEIKKIKSHFKYYYGINIHLELYRDISQLINRGL